MSPLVTNHGAATDTPHHSRWDTGKLAHTWTRVIGSLGASLDPIFSRGDIGGDVCGSSSSPSTTRVELITDDEDSTMASGSKEDEDEKEGGKITIRLPGLTRIPSRPRSQSVSDAAGGMYQCRGILKPPDRRAFAFPAVDPTPPPSSRITSTSSPTSTPGLEHVTVLSVHSAIALAPIQTTSLPSPPLDGQTVSLSPCCINCCHATDLGRDAGDDYVEKWTSGARKKRREDANGFVHRASVVVDEAEGPQSPGTPAEEDPRKSCEDEAVFHDHLPTTTVSSSTFRLIARPSPPLSDPSNLLPAEPSPTYPFDTMDSNIVGLSTVTTGKKPKSKFSFASLFPDGGARTYV